MKETGEKGFIRRHLVLLVVLAVAAIAIIYSALYIVSHDDGIIKGKVVDQAGNPVADARVSLREKAINLLKPPIRKQTDENGEFVYKDMEIIEFYISAYKEGVGSAEREWHHLYFKRQNYTIDEPIVLVPKPEEEEE